MRATILKVYFFDFLAINFGVVNVRVLICRVISPDGDLLDLGDIDL